MVFINRQSRELHAKIVYMGPSSSGKSTNLRVIAERTDKKYVGDLMSLDRDRQRTAYFDFLPMRLGKIRGYSARLHLFSIPGHIPYHTTRSMILKGVDAVVFVADSDPARVQENLAALNSLREFLKKLGPAGERMPIVFQYNKRDLGHAIAEEELARLLEVGDSPAFGAVANTGQGVFDTLRAVTKIVTDKMLGGKGK